MGPRFVNVEYQCGSAKGNRGAGCFNGATFCERGILKLIDVARSGGFSFNGATFCERGILAAMYAATVNASDVSMGPRFVNVEYPPACRRQVFEYRGFNGATFCERGIPASPDWALPG